MCSGEPHPARVEYEERVTGIYSQRSFLVEPPNPARRVLTPCSILEPTTRVLRDGSHAVIRSATREDAEGLASLYREVIAEGRWTLARAGERQPAARGRSRGDRPPQRRWRLPVPGRLRGLGGIVGTARARRAATGAPRTSPTCTRSGSAGNAAGPVSPTPSWRRWSTGPARARQIEKLGLFVFSTSEAAIALYREARIRRGRGAPPGDVKFEDGSYADTVILGCFTGPGP